MFLAFERQVARENTNVQLVILEEIKINLEISLNKIPINKTPNSRQKVCEGGY